MKKKIGILLCVLVLPLLSACGKEPESTNILTCTDRKYDGAVISDTIIKYNFDGTEIVGVDLKAVIDLSGRSAKDVGCDTSSIKECVKDLIEQMKGRCSGETYVENCQISNQSDNGFVFTATVKKGSLSNYLTPIPLKTSKKELPEKLPKYECK